MSAYRGPLGRYLFAATLARAADAGAAVGLVLLAVSPEAGLEHGVQAGGLLAAALTAPHLLGPWVARRLDGAHDGRRVLAAAFTAYGIAIAAASLGLGHVPFPLVLAAVVAAGACGPLLTGGLSSRLAGIAVARSGPVGAGRAEGWDAVTYGLAGTLGPALVAALAAATTPLAALLTLAAAAVAAAGVTLTLPAAHAAAAGAREAMTVREALRLIATHGPLRRVAAATALTAFSFGALSVFAVLLGSQLSSHGGAGASLVAA